jgi:transposase
LPLDTNTGRPRNDDREVINGILYVLTTGCGWEYLPHDIETSWRTCHRRLLEYQRRRVWQKIVSELMKLAYRKGKINHYQLKVGSMVIWLEAGSQAKAISPTECG